MREKIAKSLAHCDGMHPDAVSNDEDEFPIWTTYLDVADAVLDVLMEPTEGMCRAGDKILCDEIVCNCDEGEIFRAMIQAAKEGK